MREKLCGIYGFRNLVDGKWYVGQSIDMVHRKEGHLWLLKSGKHPNPHFQSAFRKYGLESFEFRVLAKDIPEILLDNFECAWISQLRCNQQEFGYNFESGGRVSKRITEEARQRLSEANRKRVWSEAARQKIAEANVRRVWSEDACRKISDANKGSVRSIEFRRGVAEANRRRVWSEESRRKAVKARLGTTMSLKTRQKLAEANLGRVHSPETRQKISETKKRLFGRRGTLFGRIAEGSDE
jgi:group I intron endonuclease